jgi:hypothetical protein
VCREVTGCNNNLHLHIQKTLECIKGLAMWDINAEDTTQFDGNDNEKVKVGLVIMPVDIFHRWDDKDSGSGSGINEAKHCCIT